MGFNLIQGLQNATIKFDYILTVICLTTQSRTKVLVMGHTKIELDT